MNSRDSRKTAAEPRFIDVLKDLQSLQAGVGMTVHKAEATTHIKTLPCVVDQAKYQDYDSIGLAIQETVRCSLEFLRWTLCREIMIGLLNLDGSLNNLTARKEDLKLRLGLSDYTLRELETESRFHTASCLVKFTQSHCRILDTPDSDAGDAYLYAADWAIKIIELLYFNPATPDEVIESLIGSHANRFAHGQQPLTADRIKENIARSGVSHPHDVRQSVATLVGAPKEFELTIDTPRDVERREEHLDDVHEILYTIACAIGESPEFIESSIRPAIAAYSSNE